MVMIIWVIYRSKLKSHTRLVHLCAIDFAYNPDILNSSFLYNLVAKHNTYIHTEIKDGILSLIVLTIMRLYHFLTLMHLDLNQTHSDEHFKIDPKKREDKEIITPSI